MTTTANSRPSARETEVERLRRELAHRGRQLAEAREREQATADLLRAIGGAPDDLEGVLTSIA